MTILILKALHIIGFVAWFAGLFYLVRIFVYHAEAQQKDNPERDILINQFRIMEWRVYKIICNPAMMITWTCGLIMLHLYGVEWLKENGWMHVKLLFLTLLTVYHVWMGKQMQKMQNEETRFDSYKFRLLNEVPTLFLFAIVFFAVIKDISYAGKIIGLILIVGILLFLGVKMYKKQRETN